MTEPVVVFWVSVANSGSSLTLAVLGVYALWRYRSGELQKMREEYSHRGIPDRKEFWQCIDRAYLKFRPRRSTLPQSIKDLIDAAGPPPGIEKCRNVREWELHGGTLEQRELWRFTTSIYPTPKPQELPLGDAFDLARSNLGDFWERWSKRFRRLTLANLYSKERQSLLLLSWLDPAHRRSVGEDHKGKQTMYRLASYLYRKRT